MSLHSAEDYAQIVDTYLDGWRKHGWMPECRANNLPGWTQGGTSQNLRVVFLDLRTLQNFTDNNFFLLIYPGSSADHIVGQFAVSYANEAEALGIDLEELYSAMLADAEINPPEWNTMGRQVDVYK